MSVVDNLKSIASTIREIDNIELYRKILDTQAEAMAITEENIKLKEENNLLRKKLELKGNISVKDNMLWVNNEGEIKGPYCSSCFEANDRLISLHIMDGFNRCPKCKTNVHIDNKKATEEKIHNVYGTF